MSRIRRGKSLVELTIVLASVSALLLLTGRTLIALMRADAAQTRRLVEGRTLDRLSVRFRRDVHAAAAGRVETPADGPARLVLDLPGDDERVVYLATEDGVERRRARNDEAPATETYAVLDADVSFAERPTGSVSLFELRVERSPGAGRQRARRLSWHVTAAPARREVPR